MLGAADMRHIGIGQKGHSEFGRQCRSRISDITQTGLLSALNRTLATCVSFKLRADPANLSSSRGEADLTLYQLENVDVSRVALGRQACGGQPLLRRQSERNAEQHLSYRLYRRFLSIDAFSRKKDAFT
jgi:hypothetical protein